MKSSETVAAYLAITRFYSVLPLSILVGAIGIQQTHRWDAPIVVACAIALILAGSFAYNDLHDQARDSINRPARPLIARKLTPQDAKILVTVFLGAGVAMTLLARSPRATLFSIALAISGLAYSLYVKNIPGLKNVFVAVASGVLPWAAALHALPNDSILVATSLAIALFILQKEIVADIYDQKGDQAAGMSTVATVLGPRKSLGLVLVVNAGLLVCSIIFGASIPMVAKTAAIIAAGNILVLSLLLWFNATHLRIRLYLEWQKGVLIAGCIFLAATLVG